MQKIIFSKLLMIFFSIVAAVDARSGCFIIGADISWNYRSVKNNTTYTDGGERKPLLEILRSHGFNWIRLRMFVDPTAKVPEVPNESPYSVSGDCDLEHTLDFAKYIKKAGFKFLLDFHYSDTWADPGKQYKPVSWRHLSYEDLVKKVRSYTRESLEAFKAQGVLPDMVQIGNEIVNGMIWPDGRTTNMSKFSELVNAGIDGVKDVSEDIKIMIHSVSENSPSAWLSNLIKAGVKRIDVFGLSYYSKWHGTPDDLERLLKEVTKNHDIKIIVVEYCDNHRRVNDIVFNLPDEKGIGTFVWEPTSYGEALFSGTSANQRMDLYPEMVKAYGNDTCYDKVDIRIAVKPFFPAYPAVDIKPYLWSEGKEGFGSPSSNNVDVEIFTLQGRLKGNVKTCNKTHGNSIHNNLNGVFILKK